MKNKPETPASTPATTVIRRVRGFNAWFVPTNDLDGSRSKFQAGLLRNATFNPTAPVMKDVFCGTNNVSESEVVGELEKHTYTPQVPKDATHECEVVFDKVQKTFHDVGDPARVVTSADYVVLRTDGTAIAGWRKNPFESK